jgi:hypothetical protein
MPISVDGDNNLEIKIQKLCLTMDNIIHDVAVLHNYTSEFNNNEHGKFILKPININYCDFKHLYFKKKCYKYKIFDARFLSTLFNRIKSPLIVNLLAYHNVDSKTKILLNKEIYNFSLLNEIKQNYSLHFDQFEKIINSTKEKNHVQSKITIKLFLTSISRYIEIVFLFNIKNIPELESDQLELFD